MDNRIFDIDGWMSETELQWLYNQAQAMPENSVIVDVGVWLGRSSAALYTGAGLRKSVTSIDTWAGQPSLQATDHILASRADLKELYLENMHNLGLYPQPYKGVPKNGFCYLTADSVHGSTFFPDGSVSMCFVDGDHDALDVDIEAWLPKIAPNGLFCGHDYTADPASHITQAVKRLLETPKTIDTIWYVQIKS